jgi:NADH-quinone oxidoreductase subunit M
VAENLRDIRLGEGLVLAPMVALMIFLGVFPRPVGDISNPSVTQYVSIATNQPLPATGAQ